MASSPADMLDAMSRLLRNSELAQEQAMRGRQTVLERHTCHHRAQQLTAILEELSA
jgi:spore maturation protein CgeB